MRPTAVALLVTVLVGTGLPAPHTAVAQEKEEGPSKAFVCSACGNLLESAVSVADDILAHDNVFTIDLGEDQGGALVELENMDLTRVVVKVDSTPDNREDQDTSVFDGPDANPKVIQLDEDGSAIIVAVHRSSGLRDGRAAPDENGVPVATPGGGDDYRYEVKAFHGNRVGITHQGHGANPFGGIEYVVIDNVMPALEIHAPAQPLYAKGGVDITFIAEFTDEDSGFTEDVADLTGFALTDTPGLLHPESGDHETHEGGVRLVVAGNVVNLDETHLTRIPGGWRVTRTLYSTTIQSIAAHVPWYVEVADRAHNTRRMDGAITGETAAGGTDRSVVIAAFQGGLDEDAFQGTEVRVTQAGATSDLQPVAGFTSSSGVIAAAEPFFVDDPATAVNECPGGTAAGCVIGEGAAYEILGASLITVDSAVPDAFSAVTGTAYDTAAKREITGPEGRAQATSLKVAFIDAARDGDPVPGSGLDPASVTPAAFTVTENAVASALVVGNDVYLTLQGPLASNEEPAVTVARGTIRDRVGNAIDEEQLLARDGLGPNLSLSATSRLSSGEVTVHITTDEQLHDPPALWVTRVGTGGAAPYGGEQAAVGPASVRQTGALSYSYTHNGDDDEDGVFSVYVEALDVNNNKSAAGDRRNALARSALLFEVDRKLNNGLAPIVSIGDHRDVAKETHPIEQTRTMTIRVDFSEEGNEHPGDGYETVRLTSARLEVVFADGTSRVREYYAAAEAFSIDNVTYTLDVERPQIGRYTLTLTAVDTAGNRRIGGEEAFSVSWEVAPGAPFGISLAYGWNLISLPFMPANPAINAVIPFRHPVDVVMTFDSIDGVWLVSQRDAGTGWFTGEINAMTPSTAYFVRATSGQRLTVFRPPLTRYDRPPAPPLDLPVARGWNLVPVVSQDFHIPYGIAAGEYFGGLKSGEYPGWAKALTFEPLTRRWEAVSPGDVITVGVGETNPCTGLPVEKEEVEKGAEPCQAGRYVERSPDGSSVAGDVDDEFDGKDRVTLRAAVLVGKGYWLYANRDGVIIP